MTSTTATTTTNQLETSVNTEFATTTSKLSAIEESVIKQETLKVVNNNTIHSNNEINTQRDEITNKNHFNYNCNGTNLNDKKFKIIFAQTASL